FHAVLRQRVGVRRPSLPARPPSYRYLDVPVRLRRYDRGPGRIRVAEGGEGEGDRLYGGNRTARRAKALTGACLVAGALALGSAGAALAQTPLPDTHNIPTNAVTDHVTFQDNVRGVSG